MLASITSVGSMYTVCPVADSSMITPRTFLLYSDKTGITTRPSRITGELPSGAMPFSTASRNIWSTSFLARPDSSFNFFRIRESPVLALSLTPPLSSILAWMALFTGPGRSTGAASRKRLGQASCSFLRKARQSSITWAARAISCRGPASTKLFSIAMTGYNGVGSKYCVIGKGMARSTKLLNSCPWQRSTLIMWCSVRNLISSTSPRPRPLRQYPFTNWRIWSNPSLDSKSEG